MSNSTFSFLAIIVFILTALASLGAALLGFVVLALVFAGVAVAAAFLALDSVHY